MSGISWDDNSAHTPSNRIFSHRKLEFLTETHKTAGNATFSTIYDELRSLKGFRHSKIDELWGKVTMDYDVEGATETHSEGRGHDLVRNRETQAY